MWKTTLGVIVTTVTTVTASTLLGGRSLAQQPMPSPASAGTAYQEFMTLAPDSRAKRFSALSADDKALIMRTHAEQWLAKNRGRLIAGQVELVEKAIALVRPAMYRRPQDPDLVKSMQALEAQLKCGLRRSDILQAFSTKHSAVPPASWLDDLWFWFESCILG